MTTAISFSSRTASSARWFQVVSRLLPLPVSFSGIPDPSRTIPCSGAIGGPGTVTQGLTSWARLWKQHTTPVQWRCETLSPHRLHNPCTWQIALEGGSCLLSPTSLPTCLGLRVSRCWVARGYVAGTETHPLHCEPWRGGCLQGPQSFLSLTVVMDGSSECITH